MSILVLAQHHEDQIHPATLSCISAAQQLGDTIDVLCMSNECEALIKSLQTCAGVSRVLYAQADHYQHLLAEDVANLVHHLASDYQYLMAPATAFAKDIWPRVAATLNVEQISEVTAIVSHDTFVRPIYAGNAMVTVRTTAIPCCLTVRATAFKPVALTHNVVSAVRVQALAATTLTQFIEQTHAETARPDLTQARIIVSGGRGLQSKEQFKLIEQLADCLGGAVGASRAAVDAGYIANEYQVGQTGKVVAPELYIAIGISGATQHVAGIKDSKVIVAINQDPAAEIFDIADYGLVADLFTAIPQLLHALKSS